MTESHSETCSDHTGQASYSVEYVQKLEENLNWHAAILAVMLQEAGGVVEISGKELSGIALSKAQAEISYNPDTDTYRVEGLYTEDES